MPQCQVVEVGHWPPDHAGQCVAGRGDATVQACAPLPGNAPAVEVVLIAALKRFKNRIRRADFSRFWVQFLRGIDKKKWGQWGQITKTLVSRCHH